MFDLIASGNAPLTMTSREIAELTGKRHDNVLEDVRKMLDELCLSWTGFATQYKDSTGRTLPCFNLPLSIAIAYLVRVSKNLGVKIMGEALKSSSVATEVLKALQDFEVPDDLPGLYVYAIRNTVTGNIKLGISRNPEARLKQLQTGNDCRLELVAMRPAAARFADEKALHNANAHARLSGEWFDGSVSV
jgi:hypothetical protein